MNNKKTQLVLIVDNSGSMHGLQKEVNSGIAELIKSQQNSDHEVDLEIVSFSDYYKVSFSGNVKNFKDYELMPTASTALYDAIGKTINSIGQKLAALKESDRPAIVQFNVITDGAENASKEFNINKIQEMIEHQKTKYNWQFDFMCKDLSVQQEFAKLGFQSNVMDMANIKDMYSNYGNKLCRMSKEVANSGSFCATYTEDEKRSMKLQ